jgi:hypothetical protein
LGGGGGRANAFAFATSCARADAFATAKTPVIMRTSLSDKGIHPSIRAKAGCSSVAKSADARPQKGFVLSYLSIRALDPFADAVDDALRSHGSSGMTLKTP